jgi:ribosomal protein S5
MRRTLAARLLAQLRQGSQRNWTAAADAAAGGSGAGPAAPGAPHVAGQPLPCLPATLSSSAARPPAAGSPLIRLPTSDLRALAGLQQQRQGQERQLRHFASDAGEEEQPSARREDDGDADMRQTSHVRPRWRDMTANQALHDVPYQIELAMMHRQLQDRSALEDQVREKFKMSLWDNVLVDVKRTVKVTKSAKVETFHAIVCTGNQKGMFGVGEGADGNVQKAVTAAFFKSFANIVNVPLYRGHTIYHRVDHKRHTTNIMMLPKEAGKGIRASTLMFELCQLAGIKDITIKVRCCWPACRPAAALAGRRSRRSRRSCSRRCRSRRCRLCCQTLPPLPLPPLRRRSADAAPPALAPSRAQVRGRTRNKANLVKLFVEALGKQSLPHDGVEGSGVYIREVLRPAGRRLPYGLQRGVHVP